MSSLIRDHALRSIWCTPDHDRLIMVKPVKITPNNGVIRSVRVLWETIILPTNDYYHVYQIGQVPTVVYNLPNLKNEWVLLSQIAESRNIVARLFAENGLCFPVSLCYLRYTRDNNLILAVRSLTDYPLSLDVMPVWLYLYSNQFFNSDRWNQLRIAEGKPLAVPIKYAYRQVRNPTDQAEIVSAITTAVSNSLVDTKSVVYLVNGRYVDHVTGAGQIQIGDYVEALIDSSVKQIRLVPFVDMPSFTSLLDNKNKRLMLPEVSLDTIDFIDDIDFFLTSKTTDRNIKGLYYNQLRDDSVRMVTHNSYSFAAQQIDALVLTEPLFNQESEITFTAVIRHAGYKRPLLLENRRIAELYKLDVEQIEQAMVGVNSLLPEWRADQLEASSYTKIISSFAEEITEADCEEAYGYNLITSTFCDPYPPVVGNPGQRVVHKPLGIYEATIATYGQGKLIALANGGQGASYVIPEPTTNVSLIELIPGEIKPLTQANRWYGTPVVTSNRNLRESDFRTYCCPIVNGNPNEEWFDTTSSDYYTLSTDGLTITWDMPRLFALGLYPLVIIGGQVDVTRITYDELLDVSFPIVDELLGGNILTEINDEIYTELSSTWQGRLSFQFIVRAWYSPVWPASATTPPLLRDVIPRVPTGFIDVFYDGESLIEGIDYKVAWPFVVMTKVPQRNPDQGGQLLFRTYGFCKTDLTREPLSETGFVQGGVLSTDFVYQVRNDRNIRLVVGGSCLKRSDVKFSEEGWPLVNNSFNGKPYSVRDIVMPIEHFTTRSTQTSRTISQDIDRRVGEYLTIRKPGTPPPNLNPIVIKYDLYSPFLSTTIYRLSRGWLLEELNSPYDNTDIEFWIRDYVNLLNFDPCLDLTLDLRYIFIRPHMFPDVQVVAQRQYTFLERLIKDYLTPAGHPPRIDLTSYISIIG